MSSSKQIRCALRYPSVPDIKNAINEVVGFKYTYVVCPLVNPRFKREHVTKGLDHQKLPLTRSDLLLSAECWQNYVIGQVSQFYNCDSENYEIRKNAIAGLIEELKLTCHLNLSAFIIPVRRDRIENLARVLNNFLLNRLYNFNIFIQMPLQKTSSHVEIENETIPNEDTNSTWYRWRALRSLCEENSRLGLILEMAGDLPSDEEVERWLSEPVRALIVPTELFLTNKSGFPVLSKAHQLFINKFLRLDIDIIIDGALRHKEKSMSKYVEYMNYLYKQYQLLKNDWSHKFIKGYEDCLQNPLQPLADNLESQIYEIFEKDPVKYRQYQCAIARALVDMVKETEISIKQPVIMVVGAGRGPLVRAAIQASRETNRKIKLYAIEKNPNAINTLLNLKNDEWGDQVEVVSSDMRDWEAPEKADILVSELLGSLGDNELSPECLDGAQKFLKSDGISIPYRSRSFVAPIQSYKVYTEMTRCKEYERPYEAPYVVYLNNHSRIDEEKFLFEFIHPNWTSPIDNNRYAILKFTAQFDCTLHGFSGYFDSHLYKDIDISITPKTHSKGMFSWFPMFFPLKSPIEVKKDELIVAHFWRVVTNKHVHYEWCVSSPTHSHIHNPDGRTYSIGLH